MDEKALIIMDFLSILFANSDPHTAGGCFGNTLRDIYGLVRRLGINPVNLSDNSVWQKYCKQPY